MFYVNATLEVATRKPGATSELFGGQGWLKVSRQVLADVARHLQHIQARHRENGLKLRIGLDDPTFVELELLDVGPDLLRHLRARHRLTTADRGHRRAKRLRSEDALTRLLHSERVLLG